MHFRVTPSDPASPRVLAYQPPTTEVEVVLGEVRLFRPASGSLSCSATPTETAGRRSQAITGPRRAATRHQLTARLSGRLLLRGGLRSTFAMTKFDPPTSWTWVGPFRG